MGARVYTCCRTKDKLEALLADWQAQGLDVDGCVADVSQIEARQSLVDAAHSHFDGSPHLAPAAPRSTRLASSSTKPA